MFQVDTKVISMEIMGRQRQKITKHFGLKRNRKTQINCGDCEQWEKSGTITFFTAF